MNSWKEMVLNGIEKAYKKCRCKVEPYNREQNTIIMKAHCPSHEDNFSCQVTWHSAGDECRITFLARPLKEKRIRTQEDLDEVRNYIEEQCIQSQHGSVTAG